MEKEISARDIDDLVGMGGKFLRAASIKPEIMQLLQGLGYTEAEHKQGWNLYLSMLGYMGADATPAPVRADTTDQLQALTRIDRYDEPAFRRATVALRRLHPEQYQYVFGDGLSAKTGPEAVASVRLFLDRYAALRDGSDPSRADQREADQAAAATLEARNIVNREVEAEFRSLIEVVKNPAPLPEAAPISASEEALQEAARAFKIWLGDWRPTASAGITRRDYRIMLGISRRRASKADPVQVPVAAAASAASPASSDAQH